MAFSSRCSRLWRCTLAPHCTDELRLVKSDVCWRTRFMSGTPSSKLFVGGLAWATDDNSLRDAFSSYGEILDAKVILDRETGRSKGFGFVTFASTEDADSAIKSMDGRDLNGRALRVNFAIEKPMVDRFGGAGGFGDGGGGSASFGGVGGGLGGSGAGGDGGGASFGDVGGGLGGGGGGASFGDVGEDFDTGGGGSGHGDARDLGGFDIGNDSSGGSDLGDAFGNENTGFDDIGSNDMCNDSY